MMQIAEPRDFMSCKHDDPILMPSHMAAMLHYAHFSAPCKLVLIVHSDSWFVLLQEIAAQNIPTTKFPVHLTRLQLNS